MIDIPEDGYSELFLKPDKALRRARQIIVAMLRDEQGAGTAARNPAQAAE